MADLHIQDDAHRRIRRLVEQTEGRPALEVLGGAYSQRLHRHSGDLQATYGLRLVIEKLQRTPYCPPVVTKSS